MPGTSPEKKSVLEMLESLDLEGELPEELRESSEGSDGEKVEAAKAFKNMRNALKDAKALIQEQSKELESKTVTPPANSPSSGGGSSSQQQLQVYLTTLTQRAIQNVGIADPQNPLVQLEIQRLYNDDSAKAQKMVKAKSEAGTVVQGVLDEFQQLDEDDQKVIKERIAGRDVLDQANPETVKSEVHRYIGENWNKFAGKSAGGNGDGDKDGKIPDGAAAASDVKSKGSGRGVELGKGSKGKSDVKPATPEELKRMKAIGIKEPTPEQISMFRRAEAKKGERRTYA